MIGLNGMKQLSKATSAGQGSTPPAPIGMKGISGTPNKGIGHSKENLKGYKGKKVYSAKALMKAFTMKANPAVKQMPIKLGDKGQK